MSAELPPVLGGASRVKEKQIGQEFVFFSPFHWSMASLWMTHHVGSTDRRLASS
jgi:hypothetical protein